MKNTLRLLLILFLPLSGFTQEPAEIVLPPSIETKIWKEANSGKGPLSGDEIDAEYNRLKAEAIEKYKKTDEYRKAIEEIKAQKALAKKRKPTKKVAESRIPSNSITPPYNNGAIGEQIVSRCSNVDDKETLVVFSRLFESYDDLPCADCYRKVPNEKYTFTVSYQLSDEEDKLFYGFGIFVVRDVNTVNNIHQGKSFELKKDDQNYVSYNAQTKQIKMSVNLSESYGKDGLNRQESTIIFTGIITVESEKTHAPISINNTTAAFKVIFSDGVPGGAEPLRKDSHLGCSIITSVNNPGA